MRFCVANASARPACPKRSHSPLDRAFRFVTLPSRDPTSRFSRHGLYARRDSRRVRPRPIDRSGEKEKGARRNARRDLADAVRNARTNCKTKTGESEVEKEKEGDADADTETEAKENSSGGRRNVANPETKGDEITRQKIWR